MKRALVLFLVAAVLFSSGCIELDNIFGPGETVSSGYGLVVNEFEPDFPSLESGEDFEIYLEVQNTGGSEATDVMAHLFGIETGSGGWLQVGTNAALNLGNLEPPDEVSGIPGEIKDESWALTAPGNPAGVVYEYRPKVRLIYKYRTSALARIPVMTKTEYKRLRERDMLPNTPIDTEVSKGPLGVNVIAKTPLVIDDFNEENMTFRVEIDTLGTGSVFNKSHSTSSSSFTVDELDIIDMELTVTGVNESPGTTRCRAYVNGGSDTTGEEINMRRGETAIYTCELPLNSFEASKNIPVTIDLTYGYFEDFSTSLTVTGVE